MLLVPGSGDSSPARLCCAHTDKFPTCTLLVVGCPDLCGAFVRGVLEDRFTARQPTGGVAAQRIICLSSTSGAGAVQFMRQHLCGRAGRCGAALPLVSAS